LFYYIFFTYLYFFVFIKTNYFLLFSFIIFLTVKVFFKKLIKLMFSISFYIKSFYINLLSIIGKNVKNSEEHNFLYYNIFYFIFYILYIS